MPGCGKGQTQNNERETKTILNVLFAGLDLLRIHALVEKRHGYNRQGCLTSEARVASRKRRKRLLTLSVFVLNVVSLRLEDSTIY